MNTTIYSISESPKNGQLIWAGTDDGNLQITRDGGKNWTNTAPNLPGVAQPSWISWVEASRYEESTAYAAVDRHTAGDMKPYLFKTTDYGKTWTALPLESVRGYAHVIKEDTVNPKLLFLGTEFGLWVSIDGGQRWMQFKGSNFPNVAVRDIVVHPRDADLIVATHGRGIWIVDDISPLRNLTPQLMAEEAGFLPTPPAVQWIETFGGWPGGDAAFVGETRSTEAFIPYYQKTRHIFGDLKIEIFDDQGKLIDTVPSSKHRGVNRATWNMHVRPPKTPPAASAMFQTNVGPRIVPGTYTVKMTKGDKTYTSKLNVVLDPRAKFSVEDRRANYDLAMKIGNTLNHMSWAVDAIVGVREAANQNAAKLKASDALRAKLSDLAMKTDAIRGKIVATKEGGAITGEERLREFTGGLYGDVTNYEGRPTYEQVARADVLSRELEDVIKEFQTLTSQQLPAINKLLQSKKLKPITVMTEQEWQAAQQQEAGGSAAKSEGRFERD
jgi:hypothetical protein